MRPTHFQQSTILQNNISLITVNSPFRLIVKSTFTKTHYNLSYADSDELTVAILSGHSLLHLSNQSLNDLVLATPTYNFQ